MRRLKLAAAVLLLALTAGQVCHAQISDRSPSDRAPDPARTEGLRSKGFGVFFHYLSGLQNNAETVNSLGKETTNASTNSTWSGSRIRSRRRARDTSSLP